jgi:peptide deformylase
MKIVTTPDPVLTAPTKKVEKIDGRIKKLVRDMEKTLVVQKDPEGVGLAAPQVGVNLSLFIIKAGKKKPVQVFINPRVLEIKDMKKPSAAKAKESKEEAKLEGCLSIPRVWGPLKRADKVHLEYQDLTGRKVKKWFSGFEAAIIEHEVDHLKGILFTQRSLEKNLPLYREEQGELKPLEY